MINDNCVHCDKWKEKQAEVLMKCESVFDVNIDMMMFEDECMKTCPYVKVNQENS